MVVSDSPLDLVGTEASGTGVHMARSTVDNGLDPLYIGLPSPVGTSVGVGDLNTKGNALATIITLRHHCTSYPLMLMKFCLFQALRYDSRDWRKKQAFFAKNFTFLKIILIFYFLTAIIQKKGECPMIDMSSVALTALVKEFQLEVAYAASDYEKIRLTVEDVARPGLQLAGYFDHFEPMRLQVMGNVEVSYIEKLTDEEQAITFDRLFSYKIPALLIARDIAVDPQCLEMAKKHNITILRSKEPTSTIVSAIIAYLKAALAPSITRHGVLMEVYGEGLLLIGESGIGKSEAAVELLKRGHRLIADDAVEIRKVSENSLVGSAPELIRNYVELRGIGIINVAKLFGMGAVRSENEINLVVNIVPWNTHEVYDRLGLEDQFMEILGVELPMNTIPIRPGRNLAVILEVAAMNNRQRKMGYNPAHEFTEQIDRHFEMNKAEQ